MGTPNGIGTQIEARRDRAGLTQAALAKLVGITQGTVAKYEDGSRMPSWPVLRKLGTVFHCDPVDLVKRATRRSRAA
jgi:transcriptional regulator with XRE-family HTH domain